MDDAAVVAVQLGRPPRSPVEVVRRCGLGLPVAIDVPPLLDDGTPFPTRYWLTCPLARRRIGRIEAAGGVKQAEDRLESDPELAARYAAANQRYAADRDALLPPAHTGPRPSGGIGGVGRGVKCLHAQYADYAAGHPDSPIGASVAAETEPLDCVVPCVRDGAGGPEANPDWREPAPRA